MTGRRRRASKHHVVHDAAAGLFRPIDRLLAHPETAAGLGDSLSRFRCAGFRDSMSGSQRVRMRVLSEPPDGANAQPCLAVLVADARRPAVDEPNLWRDAQAIADSHRHVGPEEGPPRVRLDDESRKSLATRPGSTPSGMLKTV